MADKGSCKSCGLKIQKTTFDQCMYCGQPLAPEQEFCDQEKQKIAQEITRREAESKRERAEREQLQRGVGGTDGYVSFDFIDPGGCGDC